MIRNVSLFMAAGMLLSAGMKPVYAQEEEGGPPRWSVGVLGMAYRSPFEAENTKADGGENIDYGVVPYIAYRGDGFYIQGLEAGYHLLKPAGGSDLSLSLDAIVGARMLPGESRNKVTVDAGLRVKLEGAFGALSVTGLQDVTGEHDGREFSARYEYSFSGEKWQLTPSVGVVWQSKGLADHMWGVTEEQQADMIADNDPVLPVYQVGESVLNYEAGLFSSYRIADNWTVIAFGGVTFLDSKIKANPGINEDIDISVALGLAYSF